MRKILFLLLICFIKLNAYEFKIYDNSTQNWISFYSNSEGKYLVNIHNGVTTKFSFNSNNAWNDIGNIAYRSSSTSEDWHASGYITKKGWQKQIINNSENLLFLNDFFTLSTQIALNFYYNNERFSSTNHINYENYQILYNEDGLAVESIVGGVWKGLYETPENSGFLYDRQNNILYDNGNVASLFQRFWFSLTGNVSKTLKLYYISILTVDVFILIVAVYLVKVLLGLIIKWITTVINNTKVNVNLGAQKRW